MNVESIVNEAKQAAKSAAAKYFQEKLGGQDQYACGFAWVEIHSHESKRLKGNTLLGKKFKSAGVQQNHHRIFQIWNPAGLGVQNVDTLEAGANAAAEVFRKYGFTAYGCSRLD